MDAKFSQRIKDVLAYSKEEAVRLGNSFIGTEHLFLGILREGEGIAIDVILSLGLSLPKVKSDIESMIKADKPLSVEDSENVPLYKSAEKALKIVYLEARTFKSETINTGHLLLSILKDDNSLVTKIFKVLGNG